MIVHDTRAMVLLGAVTFLAIWKLADLFIWLAHHVQVAWI